MNYFFRNSYLRIFEFIIIIVFTLFVPIFVSRIPDPGIQFLVFNQLSRNRILTIEGGSRTAAEHKKAGNFLFLGDFLV